MTHEIFQFKQFEVEQSRTAGMKVGTDGVLLGAWCDVEGVQRALDVGTGTGVIALMLAQRAPQARIDALDIDPGCCAQARRNAMHSPWSDRIAVLHTSVQAHAMRREYPGRSMPPVAGIAAWSRRTQPYDLIVSNPPYFSGSLLPPSAARRTARHTLALPPEELAEAAAALLADRGRLAVILPVEEARRMTEYARGHKLYPCRSLAVVPKAGGAPKRILAEYGRDPHTSGRQGVLTIADAAGVEFTEEYRTLTRDFYLKF